MCRRIHQWGSLGQIIANWQANGPALGGDDPHLNFIQLYHESPRGVRTLGLQWPPIPNLYFLDDERVGSSTFSQPGNITPPHVDGVGFTQIMAHLEGEKIWIVWPPTQNNLREIRNHAHVLGPERETRLEYWFEYLEDPEVFLIKEGDSFLLGSCAIHACISVTTSAHYGVFCVEKKSLEVANESIAALEASLEEWRRMRAEVPEKRSKRDKRYEPQMMRRQNVDRANEKLCAKVILDFYKDCRDDWRNAEGKIWRKVQAKSPSMELETFIKRTDKFMARIR